MSLLRSPLPPTHAHHLRDYNPPDTPASSQPRVTPFLKVPSPVHYRQRKRSFVDLRSFTTAPSTGPTDVDAGVLSVKSVTSPVAEGPSPLKRSRVEGGLAGPSRSPDLATFAKRRISHTKSTSLPTIDMEFEPNDNESLEGHIDYETFSTARPTLLRLAGLDAGRNALDTDVSPSKTITAPFPPPMQLKRANPKKLSLTLPSASSSTLPSETSTPYTVCPTPTFPGQGNTTSQFSTPYTPGPPKTPALAMSLGRSTLKGSRRPSLLSLVTQSALHTTDEVPPTPGGSGSSPFAAVRPVRGHARPRSQTAGEMLSISVDRASEPFILPGRGQSFPPIDEVFHLSNGGHSAAFGAGLQFGSPSTSASGSMSDSASTSSTPSTSPPLPTAFTFNMPLAFPARQPEPYAEGPIEIFPGVWLGAEDSVHQFNVYAKGKSRVRIVNVAQEIDDPFDPSYIHNPGWSMSGSSKGKEKMKLVRYPQDSLGRRPEIEYCHVRWSHGELGLADVPDGARLAEIMDGTPPDSSAEMWNFWETIRWMEEGRREGVPVLIHCQCGVSRSATLAIAYTMALAACGLMPDRLGHMKAMQDAYDFIKAKSPCIGPNHSLVFQLVDFARSLAALLSAHRAVPDAKPLETNFMSASETELSEAEWARRRKAFDESEDGSEADGQASGDAEVECVSPEEANDEARRLDQAMLLRRAMREA
ncbi:hypothetical protein IAU60_001351 [Kwoniella sp. DSM 27419]